MFQILMTVTALVCFGTSVLSAELVPPAALGANFFDAGPITTTDARGRSAQMIFTPGGTLTHTTSTGKASEGKWRLSDDGFCMQMGKAKRESCYVVLKRDDGKFSAMKRAGQPFTWEK